MLDLEGHPGAEQPCWAAGQTLEMHGSIREMVCPECGYVIDLTAQLLRAVRAKTALPCPKCREANLRMRIMLYDDGEGELEFIP